MNPRRPAARRKLVTLSAAAALLLALSTLPGCLIAIGEGQWDNGESWNDDHWGWASDIDFDSMHEHVDSLDGLESRIDELESHAETCAHCCADNH